MGQVNFNYRDPLTGMPSDQPIRKQKAIPSLNPGKVTPHVPLKLSTLPPEAEDISHEIHAAGQAIERYSPDALRNLTVLGKPGATDISDKEQGRLDMRLISTPETNPPLSI